MKRAEFYGVRHFSGIFTTVRICVRRNNIDRCYLEDNIDAAWPRAFLVVYRVQLVPAIAISTLSREKEADSSPRVFSSGRRITEKEEKNSSSISVVA